MMKLFSRIKTKTFLSSIYPIVLLCEFVGVQPIYMAIGKNRLITRTSIPKSIHTFLLFIVQAIVPFMFTYEQDNTHISINVLIFEDVVNKYLYAILGCIFVSFAFLQRKKMMKFCQYLFDIDKNLKFLLKTMDYEGEKRRILVTTVCGLIIYVIIIINAYFTQKYIQGLTKPILIVIVFATLGYFSACVNLLKQRYGFINVYLRNFAQNKIKYTSGTVLTPMDELKLLSATCGQLCEAAETINEAYTFQLASFVVLVFLGTLFGVFSTVRVWMMDAQTSTELSFGQAIRKNCSMSLFMVCMMVLIVVVCSSTQTEASETGRVVHKIINTNPQSAYLENYDFNGAEIEEIKIEPGSEEFEGYSSNETDALHFPESTVNEAATSSTKTTTDRALSPKISRRVTVAPTIKDIGDTLDATDLFVAYVASEIKTLRNRDVKKKLKRRILHALLEAGEEDDARGRQWSYDGEYDGVI